MEKIYDAPANYEDIINCSQTMDTDKFNMGADKLVIQYNIYCTYLVANKIIKINV